MTKSLGILGGTGRQGSALAKRLALDGYQIRIGSRSEQRGQAKAVELNTDLNIDSIEGGTNEYATKADVIILAIPFDQIDPILDPLANNLVDKIIIDMTVNLTFGKYITAHTHESKSSYEYVRDKFDQSKVVACLKTVSFSVLEGLEQINQTDFQMTSSDDAYKFSSQLVKPLGLDPVRIRGITHAHTIERMVALSIQINKEYKGSHAGFKVTDLVK